MTRFVSLLAALLLLLTPACADTLSADANVIVHEVSDTLYGLFFEDINHAADGGLYAELLQNRSFEYEDILNPNRYDHFTGWQFNIAPGVKAAVATDSPLHANNPTYVRVTLTGGGYRLMNLGYGGNALRGGIAVTKGESYDCSICLRAADFEGTVDLTLTDRGGRALSEPMHIAPTSEWKKYQGVLTADKTADTCLSVTLTGVGALDIDMASLMPLDRFGKEYPGGGLRRDLVEALIDLSPRFLRFPGGCVAEGSYCRENFYNWKDTVGPVETRKENFNTWGYMQSYGIGFYEYFCLAEAIGALPLPVVHAGLLCQAREVRESPLTLAETEAYAQDILDLIEFATGDPSTKWGALRAEMGHPAPFNLRYLAIGNENWDNVYFDRYAVLSEIVKERYPNITCIVAAGPVAEGALIQNSWRVIRSRFADSMVDEHYYMDSDWFLRNTQRYDRYPRTTEVFLGEFAAHEKAQGAKRPNNLYSALCEAAYMTGIERNGDIVRMCCYAPLFARDGMQQWTPDLIWFNAREVLKTPNYYVQRMFANTLGDRLVDSACDGQKLYHVVTRTDQALYVKLVSLSSEAKEIELSLGNVPDGVGHIQCLSGQPKAVNTFASPDTLVPVESECGIEGGQAMITLPPYSVTVLTFPL